MKAVRKPINVYVLQIASIGMFVDIFYEAININLFDTAKLFPDFLLSVPTSASNVVTHH